MPFEVDPQFSKSAQLAKTRRRRRIGLRIGGVVAGLAILGALTGGINRWFTADPVNIASDEIVGDKEAFALVQSEEIGNAVIPVERNAAFVDLRRDPMILRFPKETSDQTMPIAAPGGFVPERITNSGPGAIIGLRDSLFVAERRLITTLPSSADDFALFKAKRAKGVQAVLSPPEQGEMRKGEVIKVEDDSSWGTLISTDAGSLGDATQAAVYVETRIENTTSVAVTLRESARQLMFKDEVIVLNAARPLQAVLRSAGLDEQASIAAARASDRRLLLPDPLPQGSVVALRLRPGSASGVLKVMSVYGPDGYLASLAQVGAGRFEPAADPWIGADLMSRSDRLRTDAPPPREIRLLDAVYSSAIRNGLPTKLVGELIVLLAQRFDLDRFVVEGDEMVLLRSRSGGRGVQQVLYIGIHNRSEARACYVLANDRDEFGCYDFVAAARAQGTRGLGAGFLVPVNGVKTSGFGPRHHPILKQVRNHNGVDWAAPIGTPVLAVAAGKVTRAGDGGGYGNVVYLDHGGGLETRYAHLNGFATGLAQGRQVAAGEVIGFVGTTGRSTGPHLHFELRLDGRPLDPLSYAGGDAGTGTQAVEALVNQIIRVESAGIATAKNPLSSATGLGQFIESTWLRMMRDYRPDLRRRMGRAQLLALRNDPALSRAMVRNLARENEAFLRARGHQITPGRLYLAHFLGPAGANTALRADPSASVLSVMGARVVNANPFLRGKNIGALHAWSDRKMGRRAKPVAVIAPPVRAIPKAALDYRRTVDVMLESL